MENRVVYISYWDTSRLTMKTDAMDLRHVDQVPFSIQPETEFGTLSSKVFICTPLSLWPEQTICSEELSLITHNLTMLLNLNNEYFENMKRFKNV